ncbi:cupin domain-containing protein [Flaviaesturariibacter flavus]|uniref:Cupin domain-containing protein n=1 Tax=Flaviaesturariibacter flavus TaxID=2502780 RepID=A0A4R1B3B1_9BACT|nr:cupin domain-containing protein [Flaviaesturariibacter flavus]TCJ12572.1 cupin domain-containing protein [Flaviaesturariibacter flavus]
MLFLLIPAAYLAVGYLCHYLLFPEKKPDIKHYFQPGHVFYSKAEGVRQTVLRQEGGVVYCHAVIEPYAPGPPKHIHARFDEHFAVANGELSIWYGGTVKKIRPGETLLIPKGMPHKPFNETGESIAVAGEIHFPEQFAFYLSQIYGVFDRNPRLAHPFHAVLQISLFQRAGFDSYIVDGPPVWVQQLTGFLLTPLARLMGYKSYYPEYQPQVEDMATGRTPARELAAP